MGRLWAEPGHSDAFTDVVLMTQLVTSTASGDEPELVFLRLCPLGSLYELVGTGELCDARTIAALGMTAHRLGL